MKRAQNKGCKFFNVLKIITQSLNIQERILLELQITQTSHPLSILGAKNV